jgi:hypothetical protein
LKNRRQTIVLQASALKRSFARYKKQPYTRFLDTLLLYRRPLFSFAKARRIVGKTKNQNYSKVAKPQQTDKNRNHSKYE